MPTNRLQLQAVRLGTPRTPDEGLRIGTVRFLPRGVKKDQYAERDYFDVWLPTVAPSRELIAKLKAGEVTTKQFFAAYRREMKQPEARHTIDLLAALAHRTPIAIGCYCEDPANCHRSVLEELIRTAAEKSV